MIMHEASGNHNIVKMSNNDKLRDLYINMKYIRMQATKQNFAAVHRMVELDEVQKKFYDEKFVPSWARAIYKKTKLSDKQKIM